jgi:hypothetical protein
MLRLLLHIPFALLLLAAFGYMIPLQVPPWLAFPAVGGWAIAVALFCWSVHNAIALMAKETQ